MIFILFILFSINLFCQEFQSQPEIYLNTYGFSNSNPPLHYYYLQSKSNNYCYNFYTCIWYICNECSIIAYDTIYGNIGEPPRKRGFDICCDKPFTFNPYGYGLYKFTSSATNKYFYLDFRDCNYASNYCIIQGYGADIHIKYDAVVDELFVKKSNSNQYISINNGQYISIWQIFYLQNYIPNTTPLENFWNNSLALVETEDNHPMLILGSYPIQNIYNSLEYFIYKKVGNNSSFVKIATLPSTTLSYIDESISISHILGVTPVYYYVTANIIIDGEGNESSPSNIVDCNGSGQGIEKKKQGRIRDGNIDFIFINNYPNPFNPVTKIKYSVVSKEKVTLKVFDVLGNEIATLVDGIKEAGNYEVEFNVSQSATAELMAIPETIYHLEFIWQD